MPKIQDAASVAALAAQEKLRYTAVLTALNGVLDGIPENLKPIFVAAREKLNAALSGLPPLEQVQGATEANQILNYCGDVCRRQDEMMGELNAMLGRLMESMNGMKPTTALQGMVDQQIKDRLAAGDFVPKDTHLAMLGQARTTAETEFAARTESRSQRRAQLATAGLPAPADEARLDGDDAAFTATLAQANARVAEVRTALAIAGKLPDGFGSMLWADKPVYDGQLAAAKLAVDATKIRPRSPADPIVGSGAASAGAFVG